MHFWPFYWYFCPFCYFGCKMTKNAFLGPKKAKIEKSEESDPSLFFDFTWKYVTQLFFGDPVAEKETLSFNFACFWSSNTSSHYLGVMWRGNQKRKSGGNFFSLDLPNGQACQYWNTSQTPLSSPVLLKDKWKAFYTLNGIILQIILRLKCSFLTSGMCSAK